MKAEGATTTADAASADAKQGCCCKGDSCELKDPTATDAKAENAHHACCSDSCDLNMKHDATMKHDAKMKHDKKSDGSKPDCCKIKQKDKTKEKKAA